MAYRSEKEPVAHPLSERGVFPKHFENTLNVPLFTKDSVLSDIESGKPRPIVRFSNASGTLHPDVSRIDDKRIRTSASIGGTFFVIGVLAGLITVGTALAGAFIHPDFYALAAIASAITAYALAAGAIFSAMRI